MKIHECCHRIYKYSSHFQRLFCIEFMICDLRSLCCFVESCCFCLYWPVSCHYYQFLSWFDGVCHCECL